MSEHRAPHIAETVAGETNHLSPKEERRLIADCAMWARRAERAEAKLAAQFDGSNG